MTADATLAAQLRRELEDARKRLREQGDDMQREIDRLHRERTDLYEALDGSNVALREARRERDEARAEVERLRALVPVEAPKAEPARLRCAEGETRRGPDGREWYVQESCTDPYRKHAAWMVIHDTPLNNGDDPALDSGIVADDVLAAWPLVAEVPEVDEPSQGDGGAR